MPGDMFKYNKLIITVFFIFTLGTLLGVFIGTKYGGAFVVLEHLNNMEKFKKSKEELEEIGFAKCRSYYSEFTYEAYLGEQPEIGIWALKRDISIFNTLLIHHKDYKDIYSEETLYGDLMFSHARLAKLYEKVGTQNMVNENIDKSLSYASLAYPEYKVDNKKKMLEIIDRQDRNIATSKNKE